MIHNHTETLKTFELDIVVCQRRASTPKPENQRADNTTPLTITDEKIDKVAKLMRMLDNAVVLWIGIAWPDSESGPHPVQVTLKGESGETLSSMVVQTSLTTGVNPESRSTHD